MLDIAKQTIDFYMKNLQTPKIYDLKVENNPLINQKISVFITLYYKWEIRGSAWNIKEIKDNWVSEIIENTIHALSKDDRFQPVSLNEAPDLKIRIDKISSREILKEKSIKTNKKNRN